MLLRIEVLQGVLGLEVGAVLGVEIRLIVFLNSVRFQSEGYMKSVNMHDGSGGGMSTWKAFIEHV